MGDGRIKKLQVLFGLPFFETQLATEKHAYF